MNTARKPMILFVILHEISVLNASFKLAGDLEKSGKEVRYVGLPDSEEIVRANGYGFTPVFGKHFPIGSATMIGYRDLVQLGVFGYLPLLPERLALFGGFIDYLVAGGDREFIAVLENLKPDLIVFSGSPYIEWAVIMASSLRIKGVYLHTTLRPCANSGMPPITSAIIPVGGSIRQKLGILFEWGRQKIMDGIRFAGFERHTRKLACKYGLKNYRHDAVGYRKDVGVSLPELFAFHPEFDFPSVYVPGQYYIGPLICRNRKQPEFPWHALDGARPLIYCALGTHVWFSPERYKAIFGIILAAAARKPEWQWVVASGNAVTPEDMGTIPENAVLVGTAPQLALLRRASIMITHGGTGSVNECIVSGVPMVVFPLGDDQYGNAARIAYHGLGVRGNIKKLSVPYLTDLLETVNAGSYFRSQVELMREKFLDMESSEAGLKLVNTLLG